MQSFTDYVVLQESDITYDEFIQVMDDIGNERLDEDIHAANYYLSGKLAALYRTAQKDIKKISKLSDMTVASVVYALKNPTIYNILRVFRFSFKTMFRAISEAGKLVRDGLFEVIEDLSRSNLIQGIESGTVKVDEIIEKYPILKKLSGPVLAGFMLYAWLSMTFIGNFKYDMNIKAMGMALAGEYTISDFIGSKEGKTMLLLFATGGLISFPWLGNSILNLIMAIVYTGLVFAGKTELAQRIKRKIKSS